MQHNLIFKTLIFFFILNIQETIQSLRYYRRLTAIRPPIWQAKVDTQLTLPALPASPARHAIEFKYVQSYIFFQKYFIRKCVFLLQQTFLHF